MGMPKYEEVTKNGLLLKSHCCDSWYYYNGQFYKSPDSPGPYYIYRIEPTDELLGLLREKGGAESCPCCGLMKNKYEALEQQNKDVLQALEDIGVYQGTAKEPSDIITEIGRFGAVHKEMVEWMEAFVTSEGRLKYLITNGWITDEQGWVSNAPQGRTGFIDPVVAMRLEAKRILGGE
jgi:hypothetical protein